MSIPQLTAAPARQAAAIAIPSFVVGQDASGRWVAVETHGLGGGLFRSREDAVNYAQSQTLKRPDAILIASEPLEFRI